MARILRSSSPSPSMPAHWSGVWGFGMNGVRLTESLSPVALRSSRTSRAVSAAESAGSPGSPTM
jgi:hypothetical protein